MKDGEWQDGLVEWLDGFPWKWFCTLTFRPGLSEAQARWRLLRWAEHLQEEFGTQEFQWIGVPERGTTGLNFHYHVLIAGLKSGRGVTERLEFMRRWWKLAGDARIEDYRPNSGGVRYVLKHVGPHDMDSLEIHLQKQISTRITEPRSTQPIRNNFTQEE